MTVLWQENPLTPGAHPGREGTATATHFWRSRWNAAALVVAAVPFISAALVVEPRHDRYDACALVGTVSAVFDGESWRLSAKHRSQSDDLLLVGRCTCRGIRILVRSIVDCRIAEFEHGTPDETGVGQAIRVLAEWTTLESHCTASACRCAAPIRWACCCGSLSGHSLHRKYFPGQMMRHRLRSLSSDLAGGWSDGAHWEASRRWRFALAWSSLVHAWACFLVLVIRVAAVPALNIFWLRSPCLLWELFPVPYWPPVRPARQSENWRLPDSNRSC